MHHRDDRPGPRVVPVRLPDAPREVSSSSLLAARAQMSALADSDAESDHGLFVDVEGAASVGAGASSSQGDGGGLAPASAKKRTGRPYGSGRSERGIAKGKRQCAGCLKVFDAMVFPTNSVLCIQDKKAMSNLYHAAKAQGESDWLQEARQDPKKLQALLKAYHARCPDPPQGKRRGKPVILELREAVRAVSSMLRDQVGEMMHEEAFVHWAKKPHNLGLSHGDAVQRFKDLVAASGAITDTEGPPNSRTRVRVQTKTLLTYRNAIEKSKEL